MSPVVDVLQQVFFPAGHRQVSERTTTLRAVRNLMFE